MCSREDALDVMVVDDARLLSRLTQKHREVDLVRRVRRVRVGHPFEVAQRSAVVTVVTAVRGAQGERLARVVRHEDGDAAGPRVRVSGRHAVGEHVLARHVRDRVVHEHDVEGPSEPQRAHVPEDVLAVRVQLAREREHLRREIGQRAREMRLQV